MPSPPHLNRKPLIAVTMGDPCGVGPEILVKALTSDDVPRVCTPVVIGDPGALKRAADLLGERLDIQRIRNLRAIPDGTAPGTCFILSPQELSETDLRYGEPTKAACHAVVKYIEMAVELAMAETVQGVCTCPIHKANLHRHGFQFPGHTEFLRQLTGAENVVMMLAGPRLRVALATIHEALGDVPGLITRELVETTIRITLEALSRDFGLNPVRLAVAGLNPHAGEEGRFGNEESVIIRPALESFKGGPHEVSGPYPPDTLFHRAYQGEFDAVVAMYHDQGLIPIKLVHFSDAVNTTLGLPIIRTSVDHGTAYDLAGTGKAGEGSLKAAIHLAASMAGRRTAARLAK
jgi:4-hydroxythreonine-4-phosphate dehydrogenase